MADPEPPNRPQDVAPPQSDSYTAAFLFLPIVTAPLDESEISQPNGLNVAHPRPTALFFQEKDYEASPATQAGRSRFYFSNCVLFLLKSLLCRLSLTIKHPN